MKTSEQAKHEGGHVVPVSTYVAVFTALVVLTIATVLAAGQDFGPFNTVVALGIAVTKATLVVLFFMHVKYGTSLVKLYVVAAIIWLGIMMVITLSDYASRGWLSPNPKAAPYQLEDR
jgi:cytochrome c oxidase subunit IV